MIRLYKLDDSNWRPDIQALRALAVLSVIFYHFDSSLLKGGYLGVDIFFVISGFLITKLLIEKDYLEAFSGIKQFLLRRVFRVFPTIFFAFSVAVLVFSFFLLPKQHADYFMTGVWALFGLSNVFLAEKSADYFSPIVNQNPFLHSWSIGVEEQFYLIFSIALFTFFFVKRSRPRLSYVLFFLAASGFLYFYGLPNFENKNSFYLLSSRAWEFGVGVLVYFALKKYQKANLSLGRFEDVLWILSWLLLILLLVFPEAAYTQVNMAITIATGIIIFLGYEASVGNRKLLNNEPVLYVGAISYSLFIYHFFVLKLFEYYFDTSSSDYLIFAVYLSVTFVLAHLNYKFIEMPFIRAYRNPQEPRFLNKKLFQLFLIAVFSFIGSIYYLNPNFSLVKGDSERMENPKKQVQSYSNGSNIDLIVHGDSHAQQLFPFFKELKGVNVVNKTGRGCFFNDTYSYLHMGNVVDRCQKATSKLMDYLVQDSANKKALFVAARFRFYLADHLISRADTPVSVWKGPEGKLFHSEKDRLTVYFEEFERKVKRLSQAGVSVFLLAPIPELYVYSEMCLLNPEKGECQTPKRLNESFRKAFLDKVMGIQSRYNNVYIIDLFEEVCGKDTCPNIKDGSILYRDDDHLSVEGVDAVSAKIKSELLQGMKLVVED